MKKVKITDKSGIVLQTANKHLDDDVFVTVDESIMGGGVEINGLIEEYKVLAGENISAGDFIDFVNNVCKGLNTEYNSTCYYAPSCCLLEENKVFIAHIQYTASGTFLNGAIVEISGTTMTATITQLNNTTSIYMAVNCVLIENNKVFIAHSYGSDRCLAATIVEINGTEMTATTTQLNNEKNSCYKTPSCLLLENNKVFIAHSYSANYYLYGTIVEINGTEMTATTAQLQPDQYSGYGSNICVLLDTNKVFIAHGLSSNACLAATIVEIDGTTMTAKTTSITTSIKTANNLSNCVLLDTNKVFIAHSYGNSSYLYGTIVEINGTEIKATITQLNTTTYSCYYAPSCCLLEENKVFIAHAYSNTYLYCTIVDINGTSMTATTTKLNSSSSSCYYAPSCLLLEPNKVFIAHSYSNNKYLYATIYVGQQVIPMNNVIKGVAKTSGTGGNTIQVYVPNKE